MAAAKTVAQNNHCPDTVICLIPTKAPSRSSGLLQRWAQSTPTTVRSFSFIWGKESAKVGVGNEVFRLVESRHSEVECLLLEDLAASPDRALKARL